MEEDTVAVTVVIRIVVDSNCIYSNPTIIKGASSGRNKAALDFANRYVIAANQCKHKCPLFRCHQETKELPITFKVDD